MRHREYIPTRDLALYQSAAIACDLSLDPIATGGEAFTQKFSVGQRFASWLLNTPTLPVRCEIEVSPAHVAIELSGKVGSADLQPFHDRLNKLREQASAES